MKSCESCEWAGGPPQSGFKPEWPCDACKAYSNFRVKPYAAQEKTCADYSVAALNRMKGKESNLYLLVMRKPDGIQDPHRDTHVVLVIDDTKTLNDKTGWIITDIIDKT